LFGFLGVRGEGAEGGGRWGSLRDPVGVDLFPPATPAGGIDKNTKPRVNTRG